MYSILREVDKHIREKGIPFKKIRFNYSLLPTYVNQAILEEVRKARCSNEFETGCEEYELAYDMNDRLYLHATSRDKHTNVIISDNSGQNNKIVVDFPYSFLSEDRLIEKACALKHFQGVRETIRNEIKKKKEKLSMIDIVNMENSIINSLIMKMFSKLHASEESIFDYEEIDDEVDNSISSINDYIDYLNDVYQTTVKNDDDRQHMDGVMYAEPETDIIQRNGRYPGEGKNNERKNPIISIDDRLSILEDYDYMYREYAYSKSNKEIDYMSYLYNIGDDKYVLVMEPYNGIKHTKIAIIETPSEITKEDFNDMVKGYLELSCNEFISLPETVRTYHTSLNTFEGMITYTIAGIEQKMVNPSLKKKIKSLKEQ